MKELPTDFSHGAEILIAEDSTTQVEQLKHHLTTRRFAVRVARNGKQALAAALESKPALIITDVVMPEMDGYTLCKEIKAQPTLKDVPVILLTSLSRPQDVLKGLECGADNFIRKPYDEKYLLSRIDYILTNRELRKTERMEMGVRLYFGGREYFITAEKQQILDLLISTYEGAIHINEELETKQRELARERDLLHTLMDNVPDLIYFKDTASRFTTINRAQTRALGVSSPEDALGKTDFDYFTEEHARDAFADEQEILRTGKPLIGKVEEAPRPDGFSIWVSTTKMLIRDVDGNVIGTFGVSRDITQSKHAEEALRASEERFRAVAETANDAIISADERGNIVHWNRGAVNMFGYSPMEALGKPLTLIMPERFHSARREGLRRYFATGEPHVVGKTVEMTGRRKDGSEFPLDMSLASWKTSQGAFFTAIIRDITERKRAEEALRSTEERFRLMVEGVKDYAIFVLDPEGRVATWNAGAERIKGYAPEEIVGRHFSIFHTPEDVEKGHPQEVLKIAAERGRFEEEGWRVRRDGSRFWADVVITALRDASGGLRGFSKVTRDATERKRAEEALKEANKQLEAFSYTVAHDLRAPLRLMDGFATMLVEDFAPQLDPIASRYLHTVREGAQKMGRMVDDLLNLARLDRRHMELEVTPLNPVVDAVVKELQPQCADRHIEWHIGSLPSRKCDPGLIRQVFVNLLSNAVKYTRRRERTAIRVDQMMLDGQAVIFVRDNGAGFDLRYADKLFGVFQRLHREEEFEGTGVGLATVQRIIHKHGGRVWAEAAPDKGATFYFTLGEEYSVSPEASTFGAFSEVDRVRERRRDSAGGGQSG
jgi:PAS domain S-box-containing protein